MINLRKELEIENRFLVHLEKRKQRIIKRQRPRGYPKGTSLVDADSIRSQSHSGFIESLIQLSTLDEEIDECKTRIKEIKSSLREIRNLIRGLEGIEQKIKYMQLVEGKTLKEIAFETGYSYDHIRRVASKIHHKDATTL